MFWEWFSVLDCSGWSAPDGRASGCHARMRMGSPLLCYCLQLILFEEEIRWMEDSNEEKTYCNRVCFNERNRSISKCNYIDWIHFLISIWTSKIFLGLFEYLVLHNAVVQFKDSNLFDDMLIDRFDLLLGGDQPSNFSAISR